MRISQLTRATRRASIVGQAMNSSDTYDFIIIGAGSAGCVLASRLALDSCKRVLLLEAGGSDLHPFIHMPAGIARLVHNRRINWNYSTEPEPQLNGRRLYWPRGKVLGGCSSINAMCYVRGQPQDYDDWARGGAEGWSYAAVLPYFQKSAVAVSNLRSRNVLSEQFVAAGAHVGLPLTDDFNGPSQHGVGFYQVTQQHGRRCSAAVAYLRPARGWVNFELRDHSLVERIILDKGRASGVQYVRRGRRFTALCAEEVVLCAGAVNSPQVLMLSGIGPADHLRELGIPLEINLPGVGANLQDHLDICTLYKSTRPVTYDFGPLQELGVALRYVATRNGPGASNVAEAGAFLCSSQAVPRMIEGGRGGAIVSIASTAAFVGLPGRGPYCAAKAGILGLTRALSLEVAPHGIRVNAVAPGYTRTEMLQQALDDGSQQESWMLQRVPLNRLADPDEIARVVRFLAGDDAAYVTGQTVVADGGWTIQGISAAPDWLGGGAA